MVRNRPKKEKRGKKQKETEGDKGAGEQRRSKRSKRIEDSLRLNDTFERFSEFRVTDETVLNGLERSELEPKNKTEGGLSLTPQF